MTDNMVSADKVRLIGYTEPPAAEPHTAKAVPRPKGSRWADLRHSAQRSGKRPSSAAYAGDAARIGPQLRRLYHGYPARSVARSYNVSQSTISRL